MPTSFLLMLPSLTRMLVFLRCKPELEPEFLCDLVLYLFGLSSGRLELTLLTASTPLRVWLRADSAPTLIADRFLNSSIPLSILFPAPKKVSWRSLALSF